MKYKFKAFGEPLVATVLFAVGWFLMIVFLGTECGISFCPHLSKIDQVLYKSYWLVPIYLILIIVNVCLGISASKKEKLITLGQTGKQLPFFNNIRTIKSIAKFIKYVSFIFLVLVIIAITNRSLSLNSSNNTSKCQPIWNPETNDFVTSPGC